MPTGPVPLGDGESSDGGTGDGVEMFFESLPTLEFFFEPSEASSEGLK